MRDVLEELSIRPFQPDDQAAAKALILRGLEEHWGALDPSFNPDLNDIAASFAGGAFLTAWRGEQLVGVGGWKPRGGGVAQIERMSVDASCRRQGIARALLKALLESARQVGIRRVILETTETWQDAIGFYLACGFVITHYADGDVYFEMTLKEWDTDETDGPDSPD